MTALIPPKRGVNRRENNDGNGGAEVNPESLILVRPRPANHLVGQGQGDGGDIKPRPGSQQARDHENRGSRVLARDPKARGQVFVDRENVVVVIGLDENVADENAPDDGAERQLQIGVVAMAEAFSGRSEEGAGTGFGGDQRSQHCPPGDASSAQREPFEILFFPAHAQADGDDDHEVEQENRGIDGQTKIHAV